MPLNTKISGQTRYIKDKENRFLTNGRARHGYNKVESGSIINVDTIRQEIDQDLNRIDDTSVEINLFCKIIVNKAEIDNTVLSQMEQWSILGNIVSYIQYDRHPKNYFILDIRAVDQKSHKKCEIKKRNERY